MGTNPLQVKLRRELKRAKADIASYHIVHPDTHTDSAPHRCKSLTFFTLTLHPWDHPRDKVSIHTLSPSYSRPPLSLCQEVILAPGLFPREQANEKKACK